MPTRNDSGLSHGAVEKVRKSRLGGTEPKLEDSAILGGANSSLDAPKRMVDLGTGLPSFTSLFLDLKPVAEHADGAVVLYIHIPSSVIVEERFGWEAVEAYKALIANYLVGLSQDLRRERGHCVVARAFADDFVIVVPRHENDELLPTSVADGMTRHLSAIDEETAALLQVFVGTAQGKPFPKIHPERYLYRLIQQAQTEATDVGRQKISAHVRILDRCITGEQFTMLYQPIVRVGDHAVFAQEALVRCTQPELKSAHVLFNVAEQGNRIWPLSRLLRRIAACAVDRLPPDQQMFINLHPQDFDDPELLDPQGPIALHAGRAVLEVTERAAIGDLDRFRAKLASLREFGARIAIDDLGSGYSALNMVAELDPDFIKLDMTLIRAIDESPVRQNLVRNMVAFASDLGAEVVAEGVETRNELEVVAELGCHLVQGYYLAVPSPPFVLTIKAPPTRATA
jgi:EAL domain-containing protein (putative c-di-GMP-specific phosphodiesterase class I)